MVTVEQQADSQRPTAANTTRRTSGIAPSVTEVPMGSDSPTQSPLSNPQSGHGLYPEAIPEIQFPASESPSPSISANNQGNSGKQPHRRSLFTRFISHLDEHGSHHSHNPLHRATSITQSLGHFGVRPMETLFAPDMRSFDTLSGNSRQSSVASSHSGGSVQAQAAAKSRNVTRAGRQNSRNLLPNRKLSQSQSPMPGSHRHGRASVASSVGSEDSAEGNFGMTHSLDDTEALRHADLPVPISRPGQSAVLRVHREDGTFGTMACPTDVTAAELLQLVGRKFFINDIEKYHLITQYVSRVRIVHPDEQPVQELHASLFQLGYTPKENVQSGREFHSYLCRLIVTQKEMCPLPDRVRISFEKKPNRLFVSYVDIQEFPPWVMERAHMIEILDMANSTPDSINEKFVTAASNIKSLRLSAMFYHLGRVPEYLDRFTNLNYLNLSRNRLHTVDIDFSKLKNLRILNLSGNLLESLPEAIAELPLEELKVSTNYLLEYNAFIPTLRELDISYNKIQGFRSDISVMKQLERLYVSHNRLESLPAELEQLPNLELLDARFNLLASFTPVELPHVHTLLLSENLSSTRPSVASGLSSKTIMIASPAPDAEPCLPNVRFLDVENSRFKFLPGSSMNVMTVLNLTNTNLISLPENFFENLPHIEKVVLRSNSLLRLPSSIGFLSHLTYLDVSVNTLNMLPKELCELETLEYLDLHSNNLKSLPNEIWRLVNLRVLNISSNLFEVLPVLATPERQASKFSILPGDEEGRRGSTTSMLSNQSLTLSESGTMSPGSMTETGCIGLVNLKELSAADNRLTDECFEEICRLSGLEILNLSYNEITEIPTGSLRCFSRLRELYISGNHFSTLPQDDIEYIPVLESLYVNSNKLHSLPAELAKARNLKKLDVSANNLRYNVSNWPFDWNWRWNTELEYLNLSSNRRLEIRRAHANAAVPNNMDLIDFCVLPKLNTLGLIDVTLIVPSIPDQSENCRVRTYGSDMPGTRFGIADYVGEGRLSINDLVVDRFRGNDDEVLIGMFDGQSDPPNSGNKISKLIQEHIAVLFKRELGALKEDEDIDDAFRRTFLAANREIGNTALLTPEEITHSFLGQHSITAAHLSEVDRMSGSGAALLFFKKTTLHLATLGGTQCIVSRSNGEHKVLNEQHLPSVESELEHVRNAGSTITNDKIDGLARYTRLIGCYDLEQALNRAPSTYVYELSDPMDMVIVASAEFWEYISYETAADIVRVEANDPMFAALKLRDLAISYGCRSRCMVMVNELSTYPPVDQPKMSNY